MATASFATALRGTEEIQLTVIGRATGRKSTRPVWFVEEGDTLYLLPVKGSDTGWFKNVLASPVFTLSADDAAWSATAIPITEPAPVREVVEKFRAKYGKGEVAKYYSKLDVAVKVPLKSR